MGASQALDVLRSRQRNWKTMEYETHERLPLVGTLSNSALCRGVFARALPSAATLLHSWYLRRYDRLDIVNLFSETRLVPSWGLRSPFPFREFTMDPGQDLVVFVRLHLTNFQIALCAMTLGAFHPEAPVPTFDFVSQHQVPIVHIQILGSLLAVMDSSSNRLTFGQSTVETLSIINWKTGKFIFKRYWPAMDRISFRLISESHFLLLSCPLDHTSFKRIPSIQIFSISNAQHPIRTYLLPVPSANYIIRTVGIHSALTSTYSPDSKFPQASLPFMLPGHPQILVFSLSLQARHHPFDPPKHFTFVCLRDFFIKSIQNAPSTDIVEWDTWGPRNTRFFGQGLPLHQRRNMHGYRLALPHMIMDFNSVDMARDLAHHARKLDKYRDTDSEEDDAEESDDSEGSCDYSAIVDQYSVILGGLNHEFDQNIVSGLPYRLIEVPGGNHSLVLADDNLIAVNFTGHQDFHTDALQMYVM
ncbi:hypothetical protein SISSUDRAFT_1034618 [Sistotremastrum suecicum HHB10207 ss-3]|uniref:F-box domain-containing protein n=1 Tax=Sistotremastrum suecicum HHB10207 ss-3 TaxID=1314776 RepID=A0A166BTA2_9AGAM|nr:hypothetical protein SISSUDRAFT_1034618 [Sistotremastrum suecicum HHB10207 ss-3]